MSMINNIWQKGKNFLGVEYPIISGAMTWISNFELIKAVSDADIVAVNLDTIETIPVYDPISHLVYCCSREHVSDVWIAGKQRLTDGVLNTIDENKLKQDCIRISEGIKDSFKF